MDKLRILKEFERLALKKTLDSDEIRLYLLLLVNCGATGQGEISYSTITGALGNAFFPARLKRVCRRLSAHGLIEVIFPFPDKIAEEDFMLAYRILPLAEGQRH